MKLLILLACMQLAQLGGIAFAQESQPSLVQKINPPTVMTDSTSQHYTATAGFYDICQGFNDIVIPAADGSSDVIAECTDGKWHRVPPKSAEPVDVPAVQEEREIAIVPCKVQPTCKSVKDFCYTAMCESTKSVTTCADKSRVLLTTENGQKHCIKF